jgi:hypothetical protein
MKLSPNPPAKRHSPGALLIECLVYIAVFAILMGIGTAAFYFCWDHTRGVILTANDVESILRAGESWRADVRAATGAMAIVPTASGEVVTIPEGGKDILYRLDGGELRREIASQNSSRLLLQRVKTSVMTTELRAGVAACRWELEVTPRRQMPHFPLVFTFEAVPSKS